MISDDLKHDLSLLTGDNLDINIKIIIPYIKKKVIKYLAPHGALGNFHIQKLIDPENFDDCWVLSHCRSILMYINFIDSAIFKNIVSEERQAYKRITEKFITEFKKFNTMLRMMKLTALYDPNKDKILTDVFMRRSAQSMEAFTTTILNTNYPYMDICSPLKESYQKNIDPFIIRHSIELKIKSEMLGIAYAFINKGNLKKPAIINISQYISFLKKYQYEFFELPSSIDIDDISAVNRWSNNYVHTGQYEYIWVVKSVLTTLKPLFSSQDENGAISTVGYTYRSKNFKIEELQAALSDFFGKKYQFIFYKD